tara:strand:+ start:71 stop:607 length:537 start_codon:yes stop_codon:yes gene_type:complete
MKKVYLLFAFISFIGFSQEKYLTKTGLLNFEASVPSFEEIKATNTNVTAIFNAANGQFATLALVKGFRFKNALMEEHFNESYAESDSYPKAVFKGELIGYTENNTLGSYPIKGTLSFHGVTKNIQNVIVQIINSENKLTFNGAFELNPKEFDVEIPKIVSSKIADSVTVVFEFSMTKK